MANYYIFKANKRTGKTTLICNGSHDSEKECRSHWQIYMYGFMDAATEIIGGLSFKMEKGSRELSFILTSAALDDAVEYFMLLDKEGVGLVYGISRTGNTSNE